MSNFTIPAIGAVILCATCYAVGRQSANDSDRKASTLFAVLKDAKLTTALHPDGGGPQGMTSEKMPEIGASFDAVASDPIATAHTVTGTFGRYYIALGTGENPVAAANEASLNMQALTVAQNARIIALLSKIASAKTSPK